MKEFSLGTVENASSDNQPQPLLSRHPQTSLTLMSSYNATSAVNATPHHLPSPVLSNWVIVCSRIVPGRIMENGKTKYEIIYFHIK